MTTTNFKNVFQANGYAVWEVLQGSLEFGRYHVVDSRRVPVCQHSDDAISSHEFLRGAIDAAKRYEANDLRRGRTG